jgi:hypothetical protein
MLDVGVVVYGRREQEKGKKMPLAFGKVCHLKGIWRR